MDEKRKEDEVLELTAEEIDEIIFQEQIASGEYNEEVPEYYFSNPDPYAKVEPRPDDKKRLTQAEKRIGELDRLFIKIYEDNAKGKLNDDRFAMMSKTYEDEQTQLKVEIVNLQKEVEVQERQIENLEQFIQRARRYTNLTELTPYALRELVKAVYVEAPDKSSGKRKQKVHIEYDLVGYIPVDELIKAEQA